MTTASAAIAKPSRRRSTLNRQRSIAGFLFVLPAVLFTLAMFIFPLLMTVWMSLHDWPLLGQATFLGIQNYVEMARDKQFWASLWFTTQYTLLVTPAIFILAFALALLVNTALRGIGVFRTIYFIPVVIGLGASSLLWVWLLNDRVGIINGLLLDLGLIERPIIWFVDKNLALAVIIISVVWKTVGFSMILLLAGMQAIPEELYQAAMVDGANYRQRLTHIMMPLLRSTFALALVLSVIGSYLSFDQFYIMTRGGPQNQTITAVYWIFNNSFTYYKMGYGAALSIILLIILGALSILQLRILRDDVTY
ncbi:sugar ABC transporter permease [Caldilinea sp.]|uniref:carbohydrate ABC transporter permease n=1 Tax=Caldilinea sp. TaxID=2293560 RepID=UPI002B696A64|nr:sugar ABC transporter permease [Caldilinea sp.]